MRTAHNQSKKSERNETNQRSRHPQSTSALNSVPNTSSLSPATLMQMQQMYGNQAVQRLTEERHVLHEHMAIRSPSVQRDCEDCGEDLQLQRQPLDVGQPLTSSTVQRDEDENREQLMDDMQDDLQTNITAFNTGMNSAAIRFMRAARAEIAGLSTADQSKLWVKFGLAVAGLALPALAPMIGLSAGGISLIVGTMNLTMDDALNQETDDTERLQSQEDAILNYFIGDSNSVQSNLDSVNREDAARHYIEERERTHCYEYSSSSVRDDFRERFQSRIFEPELLQGRNVRVSPVNEHIFDQMMRMWHLSTVADQADHARSDECFMGQCSGDSVEAFVERTIELFPDFLTQMREHMPSRYHYWLVEKDGAMNAWEVLRFREDIRALADIVQSDEFGTERQIHWSEGPAVWAN